jgi:hypothetical protein
MVENDSKTCGATTRSGGLCKKIPMANGRCYYHGGPSPGAPKGNQYNFKHGIYAKYLSEEDLEVYLGSEIGTLDHEIRLTKVRIVRILVQLQEVELDPANMRNVSGFVISEIKRRAGIDKDGSTATGSETFMRRPDYDSMLNKWLGRLVTLERTRAESLGDGGANSDELRAAILADISDIDRMTGGGGD